MAVGHGVRARHWDPRTDDEPVFHFRNTRPQIGFVVRIGVLVSLRRSMFRRFAFAAVLIAAADARADREAAGIHFQAAQAAERRGDWRTVIAEYERAYQLAPHPSVLFNLAHAHEKLDQARQAADLLERYLRDDPKTEDRVAVRERITKLRERPSKLQLGEPRGATVIVDGEARGTTPITLELPHGKHTIQLEQRGDRSNEEQVSSEYGETLEPSFTIIPRVPPPPPPEKATIGFGFGLGLHTGLGGEWNATAPVSLSFKLRGSYTMVGKLRVFAEVAGVLGPQIEDDRVGIDLGPKEQFVLFQPRAGLAWNLYSHHAVRIDAFGAAMLVAGYHSLSFGTEQVAKQGVAGAGLGGGIDVYFRSEKSPRALWYVSGGFYVVPASVGSDTGFRSEGAANLGGLEFSAGWAIKLGMPKAQNTSTWSATR
jgi:hypothetical protein